MDAIRKQVEMRKSAEDAAKGSKKAEKKAHKEAKKEAKRAEKADRRAKKHGKEVFSPCLSCHTCMLAFWSEPAADLLRLFHSFSKTC